MEVGKEIDQDLIQRLLLMDSAFMGKFERIKDTIVDNLGEYAGGLSSLGKDKKSESGDDATPRDSDFKTEPKPESNMDKLLGPTMEKLMIKFSGGESEDDGGIVGKIKSMVSGGDDDEDGGFMGKMKAMMSSGDEDGDDGGGVFGKIKSLFDSGAGEGGDECCPDTGMMMEKIGEVGVDTNAPFSMDTDKDDDQSNPVLDKISSIGEESIFTHDEKGDDGDASVLSTINDTITGLSPADNPDESVFEDSSAPQEVIIVGFEGDGSAKLDKITGGLKKGKSGDDDVDIKKGAKGKLGGFLQGIGQKLIGSMGLTVPGWISSAATAAGAAAPVIMLVGGIIWAAIDGIRGFMSADKWGVSKVSGAMGGLLGGMDKGLKGAVKNMGKWALIGAGIGSFVPVVGTILGGLIGGVIGAILGWIGGERIAKAFDAVGKWFTEKWNALTDFIADKMLSIYEYWRDLFVSIGNWFKEKWAWLKAKINDVMLLIGDTLILMIDQITLPYKLLWKYMKIAGKWLADKFNALTDFVADMMLNIYEAWKERFMKLWEGLKAVGKWLGDKFKLIKDFVMNIFSNTETTWKEKLMLLWEGFKAVGAWMAEKFGQIKKIVIEKALIIWDRIKEIFGKLFDGLKAVGAWFANKYPELTKKILAGVTVVWEFLKGIGTKIADIFGKIKTAFTEKWTSMMDGVSKVFESVGVWFNGLKDTIKDKITAIKDFFKGILDKINPLKWFGDDETDESKDLKAEAKRKKKEAKAREKERKKRWREDEDDYRARIAELDKAESDARNIENARLAKEKALSEKTSGGPNITTPKPAEPTEASKETTESNKRVEETLTKLADTLIISGERNEELLGMLVEKPAVVIPPAPLDTGGMRGSASDVAFTQRKDHHLAKGGGV